MTNTERTTVNGPWMIGPTASDGYVPVHRLVEGDCGYVFATEARADLEALRDALIEHLAPEKPAGPTHLAVFNVMTLSGDMGWASLPVTIGLGGLDLDGVGRISNEARATFGSSGVVLINLIPLAGA